MDCNNKLVFCLSDLAKYFNESAPKNIEGLITQNQNLLRLINKILKENDSREIESFSIPLREISLLAPLVFPPKIICLGLNYLDHATESKASIPEEPIIFMKPRTAIVGPNQPIICPDFVKTLDYEGELAIVIGKKAKEISLSRARKSIFGFTIMNDVSARKIQFKDGQWTRGKSFDTFAPIGPCIATMDEFKDIDDLNIRTWVNNELRQNSTTRNMVFSVDHIIHQLSRVMTLEPCDIIATGTPAGVGFAMNPPQFLKSGDVIRIEIEGIGVLENIVK